MMQGLCLVCNDINHFNNAVSDARRIANLIERFIHERIQEKPSDHMLRELKQGLQFDKKHVHFMCGHCYKINQMELVNAEREIDESLIQFAIQLKSNIEDNKQFYHEILRYLSGHYPGKYKALENFYIKVNKKE